MGEGSSKSYNLMEELRLNFLRVSAPSHVWFLVCLGKAKAEHEDLVYFNAARLSNGENFLEKFTELFP